jgi:hypothetical protein
MRLYIDLSCFNRPFDNQSQERIRHETEAVLAILRRISDGNDTLLWSWALTFENSKHPKPDRRDEIALWERRSEKTVNLSSFLEDRIREIAKKGIHPLDAAHLASAVIGGAEVFVTCDDMILRRSSRLAVPLRILDPVAYLSEVTAHG